MNEIDTSDEKQFDDDDDDDDDDDSDQDVREITRELIDLVKSEDELLAENMQVISNLQLHPSNINVNIKYNFVTQEETLHKNATAARSELRTALERIESLKLDAASTTEDPLLRLIDNVVQTQEVPSKDDIHNKQLQINPIPVTSGKKTATEIAPRSSGRVPIIAVDKDLYVATTTATTRTQRDEDNDDIRRVGLQ